MSIEQEARLDAQKSHLIISALFPTPETARAAYASVVPSLIEPGHAGLIMRSPKVEIGDDLHDVLLENEVKTGAAAGGALGALAGLLVGISTVVVPGIGPALAAGPILTTLFGTGAGALTGGLVGALGTYGFEERLVSFYEEGLKQGNVLLLLACESFEQANEVKARLDRFDPLAPESPDLGHWHVTRSSGSEATV